MRPYTISIDQIFFLRFVAIEKCKGKFAFVPSGRFSMSMLNHFEEILLYSDF